MAELVNLEDAKKQARISHTAEDSTLQILLTAAQGIVIDHIDQRVDSDAADEWTVEIAAWTDETVPENVRAAILIQFAAMARFRGDDEEKVTPFDDDGLAKGVRGLLRRFRDPAVA